MNLKLNQTKILLERYARLIISKYSEHIATISSKKPQVSFVIMQDDLEENYIEFRLDSYWAYIESGRGPGKMPPLPAIESWLVRKRILPRPIALKSGKQRIPSMKQLSFVIARNIGRKGIPARPFLSKSIDEVTNDLENDLISALEEDLEATVEDDLDEME